MDTEDWRVYPNALRVFPDSIIRPCRDYATLLVARNVRVPLDDEGGQNVPRQDTPEIAPEGECLARWEIVRRLLGRQQRGITSRSRAGVGH
jgi:hypothetical protein